MEWFWFFFSPRTSPPLFHLFSSLCALCFLLFISFLSLLTSKEKKKNFSIFTWKLLSNLLFTSHPQYNKDKFFKYELHQHFFTIYKPTKRKISWCVHITKPFLRKPCIWRPVAILFNYCWQLPIIFKRFGPKKKRYEKNCKKKTKWRLSAI